MTVSFSNTFHGRNLRLDDEFLMYFFFLPEETTITLPSLKQKFRVYENGWFRFEFPFGVLPA